jgi:hypothetical protein
MPLFLYIFYSSVSIHTFIQSFTHNIRWGPSPYLHSCRLSGAEPPWGAEPRFELGPALQQASALPTELRCNQFSDTNNFSPFRLSFPPPLIPLPPSLIHVRSLNVKPPWGEDTCFKSARSLPFLVIRGANTHDACIFLLTYQLPHW